MSLVIVRSACFGREPPELPISSSSRSYPVDARSRDRGPSAPRPVRNCSAPPSAAVSVPRPRQHHALSSGAEFLANRHHVGQRLAGMMHGRLQIDYRHGRVLRKRAQNRISPLFLPVFELRERPHSDRDAIPFEHTNKLGNVLRFIAVHHGALAMLERPTRAAGSSTTALPPARRCRPASTRVSANWD